jgi:hypothetical protein
LMAVIFVVGILLFWVANYFLRNQPPPARQMHWPDKSKVKQLLIIGVLASCAGWIMLGFTWWIQKK